MTDEQATERLIIAIFGEPTETAVDNGSDGIDDDEFVQWESPEAAELYA